MVLAAGSSSYIIPAQVEELPVVVRLRAEGPFRPRVLAGPAPVVVDAESLGSKGQLEARGLKHARQNQILVLVFLYLLVILAPSGPASSSSSTPVVCALPRAGVLGLAVRLEAFLGREVRGGRVFVGGCLGVEDLAEHLRGVVEIPQAGSPTFRAGCPIF